MCPLRRGLRRERANPLGRIPAPSWGREGGPCLLVLCQSVVVSGCVSVSLSVCLSDCVCVCLALGVCVSLSLSCLCARWWGGSCSRLPPGAWARGQWKGLDPVSEAPARGPWARPLGDASGPDPWARPPPGPWASQKKSPEKKKRPDFQKNAKSMRLFAFSSLEV